jgi:two-component system NarL family sensor kinase
MDQQLMNKAHILFLLKKNTHWGLLILFQLAAISPLHAQEKKLLGPDTSLINKTIKKAYKLRESNADSASLLYQQTLDASKSIGFRNGIAESLCGIARYYNIKNEQATAVKYVHEAIPYIEDNQKGKQLFVSANILLSEAYFYLGAFDSCSYYRYTALNFVDNNQIDNAPLRLSVYSKILQFWLNAHEEIKHDENVRQIMQRINAIEKEAIAKNDSNVLLNVYFQKEGYYHNILKNDSARYFGLKNIEFCKRLKGSPSMIMAAYLNIALTYIDDKNPDAAIENIRLAVAAAPEQGKASNRYLIFADIFLGEAYILKGRFQDAVNLVLPALAEAEKLNIINILEHAHKTLADAYEGLGKYKEEAEQRKLYSIAKDSLMKTQKMELSYTMEMKYRIAEKNKELAEKELSIIKNNNRIRNKNILIGCITAGLLLISIISLLIMRNNRHKQKLQAEKILGLQQDMEIKTLRAMVSGSEKERSRIARDLHDGISGTVGAIRAMVGRLSRKPAAETATEDFAEVMQLLEEASAEIRKTAHNLMPEILLQEGLVNATELFCERTSKSHSIDIRFAAFGEIKRMPAELELALYRTIQELVNNILKHAAASSALVQMNFNKSILGITVEDDGKGIVAGRQPKDYGVGLKTIAERIRSWNGSIDISGKPGEGTSIYIEIDTDNTKQPAI